MIKEDKTRFSVTFNKKDIEVFKEVSTEANISISSLISMSAVYGLQHIIANAKKQKVKEE